MNGRFAGKGEKQRRFLCFVDDSGSLFGTWMINPALKLSKARRRK